MQQAQLMSVISVFQTIFTNIFEPGNHLLYFRILGKKISKGFWRVVFFFFKSKMDGLIDRDSINTAGKKQPNLEETVKM